MTVDGNSISTTWNPIGGNDTIGDVLGLQQPRHVLVDVPDLFADDIRSDDIATVFAVMATADQHTFQVSTATPGRMHKLLRADPFREAIGDVIDRLDMAEERKRNALAAVAAWPLPNLWLGVTIHDTESAQRRIPALLTTPAAIRFAEAAPLIGPLDLDVPQCEWHGREATLTDPQGIERCRDCVADGWLGELSFGHWLDPLNGGLNWVIAAGECGPSARPMHPTWVRTIRDQCTKADVPFLLRGWGEWTAFTDEPIEPTHWVSEADGRILSEDMAIADGGRFHGMFPVGARVAGRALDGQIWDQYPTTAQVVR